MSWQRYLGLHSLFVVLIWGLNFIFFNLGLGPILLLIGAYLFVQLLPWAFFPFFSRAFADLDDFGWGLSKVFSLFFLATFVWLLNRVLAIPYHGISIIFCVLMLTLVFWFQWGREVKVTIKNNYFKLGIVDAGFALIFILFLSIRSFNPEIQWGEKFMDSTFLNFFSRFKNGEVYDPWAWGHQVKYYYFAYFVHVIPFKIFQVPKDVLFNTVIAFIPALFFSSLYSFFLYLLRKIKASFLAAMGLVIFSNFEILRLILSGKPFVFGTFWGATRIFQNNYFAEHPSWSFLFADVHPHVMTYALAPCLFLMLIRFLKSQKLCPVKILFFALVLGSILASNTWDVIIYGILCLVFILHFMLRDFSFLTLKKITTLFIPLLCALVLFFPILSHLSGGNPLRYGLVTANHNGFFELMRHSGHWILAFYLLVGTSFRKPCKRHLYWPAFTILVFKIISLLILLFSSDQLLPWGLEVFYLITYTFLFLFGNQKDSSNYRVAMSFALSAFFLADLSEHYFFMDWMNTIFKTFNNIYIVLGIACLLLYFEPNDRPKWQKWCARMFSILLIIGFLINTFILINPRNRAWQQVKGGRPTLEGSKYLEVYSKNERDMIRWMNQNIEGTPLMIEAVGKSFSKFARVSAYTGLPLLLGWPNHVRIRGLKYSQQIKRKNIIKNIYTSPDILKSYHLLQQHRIEFIYIGHLEQSLYKNNVTDSFDQYPQYFQLMQQFGDVKLYRVISTQGRRDGLHKEVDPQPRPLEIPAI